MIELIGFKSDGNNSEEEEGQSTNFYEMGFKSSLIHW